MSNKFTNKKYKYAANNNAEIIFGINSVADVLRFSDTALCIYIDGGIDKNKNRGIGQIINMANKQGLKLNFVSRDILDKMSKSQNHQGVCAECRAFEYTDLGAAISRTSDTKKALIVILDHIKDAGNLGAIIRSAEACGATAVIIPNKRSAEISAATYKTSAGSVINMPIVRVANISAAIEQLKQSGFWVCAASEHSDCEVWDTNLQGKIALVMGGEHEGVSQLVLKNSDFIAKLPIKGRVQSLNVAQACSVFCYEWVRQNR